MLTFSVIIPTFNRANFVLRAIRSVLNQSYQNFEIIVVDNSSNDRTVELIREFQDPRIRIMTIQNQGIIAKSRNLGISNSRGAYIAFLDSDDFWDRRKLEMIERSRVEHHDSIDVFIHDYKVTNHLYNLKLLLAPLSSKYSGRVIPMEDYFYRYKAMIATSCSVVKKTVLDRVNGYNSSEKLIGIEDLDLWLRLAKDGYSLYHSTLSLATLTVGHESVSSSTNTFRGIRALIYATTAPFSLTNNCIPIITRYGFVKAMVGVGRFRSVEKIIFSERFSIPLSYKIRLCLMLYIIGFTRRL